MLKLIFGIVLRSAIYIWLYIIIGLFSDFLLPEFGTTTAQYLYSVGSAVVIFAIFMAYMKYDQIAFVRIFTMKGALPVVVVSLVLIWIAICMAWYSEIDRFQDVESFMFYETIMVVLAFPSSILGMLLRITFFQVLEIDTNSILELRQQLIILWLIYFIPFLFQLYLLMRYFKEKVK